MSEQDDETTGDEPTEPERTASGRKKRSDAGKSRGGSSGRKHVSTRFERRSKAVTETIRELIQIGRPKLDIGELSFVEVVNRDADAWGRFFAQVAEWIVPFGSAIDLAFGSPLVTLLNMAPSFRAGRRDLRESRERRAAERAERQEAERQEEIAAEHAPEVDHGVFAPQPPPADPRLGVVEPDPRQAWLGNGGE